MRPETRSSIAFAFVLATVATVRLEIFDVRGRSIRAYEPGLLAAGDHELTWDGRSSDGRPAGQGIYFLRATGPGIALSRAVVRLE